MDITLQIPPGLDQSILLAVMVGMALMLLLSETFGWVFVGVVVPGYLASILLIQPTAGVAVIVDSILTYLLARALAWTLERTGATSEVFGRERFLMIVMVSVLVRQHTQSWVLPYLFSIVFETFGHRLPLNAEISHGFFSIGLVLVPLTANILWKLRLPKGLFQLGITLGITYLILTHILLPHSTLSFSSTELNYENAAVDFLGNAKVYILFLVSAYVAAMVNLRYGWDFNGILIPALLTLLWLHPAKLAVTLAEAVVLYWIMRVVPKLPVFRTLNLEGPRKIALVFTIAIALKWALGVGLGPRLPTINITDLFGFGYLMSSLLATKMLQKKSARQVLLPAVSTSAVGFILGSILGFALEFALPVGPRLNAEPRQPTRPSLRLLRSPRGVGLLARIRASQPPTLPKGYSAMRTYDKLWSHIADLIRTDDPFYFHAARLNAEQIGLNFSPLPKQLQQHRQGYLLFEREPADGSTHSWETALVYPQATGPILQVPMPSSQPPIAETAPILCAALDCRAVVFAGQDDLAPRTSQRASGFAVAQSHLKSFSTVQLRADYLAPLRQPVFHIGTQLPEDIDIAKLWPNANVRLDWSPPALPEGVPTPPHSLGSPGFTVLRIHPYDLTKRLANQAPTVFRSDHLLSLLRDRRSDVDGSYVGERYRPPSESELVALETVLAAPFLKAIDRPPTYQGDSLISYYAELMDFSLWIVDDCDGSSCRALIETHADERQGWGTLVVRSGTISARSISEHQTHIVQIPRPWKSFGTFDLGTHLWSELGGEALVIAGADQSPTPGLTPDPTTTSNLRTPFQAFHQAIERWATKRSGPTPLVLQLGALAHWRAVNADMVVGLGRPVLEAFQVPKSLTDQFRPNAVFGFASNFLYSDGSPSLFSLSGSGIPQLEYSLEFGATDVAVLWMAPAVRERFRTRDYQGELKRLRRFGIYPNAVDELDTLTRPFRETPAHTDANEQAATHKSLVDLALGYAQSNNPHYLERLLHSIQLSETSSIDAHIGTRSGAPVLIVQSPTERSLIFLSPHDHAQYIAPEIPLTATGIISESTPRARLKRLLFQRVTTIHVVDRATPMKMEENK